jgi:REP element-mobilizing transposase RayT
MATRRFHDRRTIRLPGWNYRRAGWYFITINTWGSCHTLARVRDGRMVLTRMGEIVGACWEEIPQHFPFARLDAFVVMPNHVHGIIRIAKSTGDSLMPASQIRNGSLPAIVRSFKAASTRIVRNEIARYLPLWHRNYYERILSDRLALDTVRRYIANNPARWISSRHE